MVVMTRLQANVVLLLTAVVWGTTFTIQQLAMAHMGPTFYTGARFLLGAVIVLPLAVAQRRRLTRAGWHLAPAERGGLVVIGICLFLGALLQQIGIAYTTVSNAGFLTALYVPLTPVIAVLALRQFPHWSVWPAAVGCTIGAYILSGGDLAAIRPGDLWVIGGAFFWAIHVLLVGALARRTGAPFVVACVQFFVCAALGLGWGAAVEPVSLDALIAAAPYIAYGGVMSVGIGFTLQVVGQQYTPAPDAAIILSSETVFAALTGMVFLGERLNAMELAGCALILAGVLAVELLPVWLAARPARKAA
jgi:drug/metabolite transporter (DMT)-like permease